MLFTPTTVLLFGQQQCLNGAVLLYTPTTVLEDGSR
jgi:hypothetical protein